MRQNNQLGFGVNAQNLEKKGVLMRRRLKTEVSLEPAFKTKARVVEFYRHGNLILAMARFKPEGDRIIKDEYRPLSLTRTVQRKNAHYDNRKKVNQQ